MRCAATWARSRAASAPTWTRSRGCSRCWARPRRSTRMSGRLGRIRGTLGRMRGRRGRMSGRLGGRCALADVTTARPTLGERLGQTFRALHHRDFRLFWCGQVVSNTGSWMQSIAQAWLVLKLTDSPLALGSVTMLQALPVLLLGLFGGVIADRFPKRKLLLCTQLIMLCQAIALGILTLTGLIQLWHIYLLAL